MTAWAARLVERHPLIVLVVVLILSGLAVWSASKITVVTSQETFLSPNSAAFQGYRAYEKAFGGDSLVVLVPASPLEIASPENLQTLSELERKLSADPRVRSVVSPFSLLEAAGSQQAIDLSDPQSAMQAVLADPELMEQLSRFFQNDHLLIAVRLAGGLSTKEQSQVSLFVQETLAAYPFTAQAIVAGNPRLIGDITSAILSGLVRTGAIAVALMVIILFVSFPARWRLLSLPLVLLGTLWTFGLAGVFKVPLTLVTLAGLPVLIGLGVDFSIQFHNRYEEEMASGRPPSEALAGSIAHIAPTVGVAVVVMVMGFVTLLLSSVPAVQDFGLLLAIGAAVLYIVALFVLNAFLYRFDRAPRDKRHGRLGRRLQKAAAADWLALGTLLPRVARWSRRHAVWVVGISVILAALGLAADRDLNVQTDIEKLVPADTPGVVALDQAREIIGRGNELPLLVSAPDVTDPSFVHWLIDFQGQIMAAHPEIVGVESLATILPSTLGGSEGEELSAEQVKDYLAEMPSQIRDSLVSPDGKKASVTFSLKEMEMQSVARLIDDILALADRSGADQAFSVVPGGTLTLAARTVQAFTENRGLISGLGILVVLLGLLVIYRDWRRAVIAVVPIALVTGWSSAFMWVTGVDLNPLTAVLGALVIAVGTEFTVLLLSRYWEERTNGVAHNTAMDKAVTQIGRAIAASALTVAGGFAALIWSGFPALRDFGIVTVVDVIFSLLVTVTVVPALVRWVDRDKPAPQSVSSINSLPGSR